jgi:DNA repair exonuclease SbcCD ATPase subunit
MKRIIVVLGVLVLAASLVGAQEAVKAQLMKRLGLTDPQAEKFIAIYTDSAEELAKARAEIAVQKALLAKLLLDVNVSDREVEKVLRQAMEAEIQVRMTQIRRELAARKLIGDKRWRQLRDLLRRLAAQKARIAARNAPARPPQPELDEKEQALLQELADVLGE